MPSCKDVCETRAAKDDDDDEEDEDDYSSKPGEDSNANRRRRVKRDQYYMGGYTTGRMPGSCKMSSACRSAAGVTLPHGLPPYMANIIRTNADLNADQYLSDSFGPKYVPGYDDQESPGGGYSRGPPGGKSNAPKLHYELEPVLTDLYGAGKQQPQQQQQQQQQQQPWQQWQQKQQQDGTLGNDNNNISKSVQM